MEVTESLTEKENPLHALNSLGYDQNKKHEQHEGKLDHGSGSVSSGTYAKAC
jgi:hypothetical protein